LELEHVILDKNNEKKNKVFDFIAPFYGLFYGYQKRYYNSILDGIHNELDFSLYENIIDIGCGTGALCSVLNQRGLKVTGVDSVRGMLKIAARKKENKEINFIKANFLEKLPFKDKSFDISIAAYVAHGLKEIERKIMYAEMGRITKCFVIIHDYNGKRSVATNIIEWLEGGDYFNFIKKAKSELIKNFKSIQVIEVDLKASWYVCVPEDQYIL
jgi:ubiquinone/menaquinone biosynthesis C-methylase UbiE